MACVLPVDAGECACAVATARECASAWRVVPGGDGGASGAAADDDDAQSISGTGGGFTLLDFPLSSQ